MPAIAYAWNIAMAYELSMSTQWRRASIDDSKCRGENIIIDAASWWLIAYRHEAFRPRCQHVKYRRAATTPRRVLWIEAGSRRVMTCRRWDKLINESGIICYIWYAYKSATPISTTLGAAECQGDARRASLTLRIAASPSEMTYGYQLVWDTGLYFEIISALPVEKS